MDIEEQLDKMRDIQTLILEYLVDYENNESSYKDLMQKIDDSKIREDKDDLIIFFNLILQISSNLFRNPGFFEKIFHILDNFKNDYTKIFTNDEIFKLFKKNKRVILNFIDEKIITIDESIISIIQKKKSTDKTANFIQYFPEIRSIIEKKNIEDILKELPEDFEEKRRKGENESYICELIRDDSVIDFVTYINKTNLSISTMIKPSIYETNSLLIKETPSLIEYAAFFGSFQIFQYLFRNSAEMNQSLWKYAIHGKNPEIIHFLEDNKVKLQDDYYGECLTEAFKCHHGEIDQYFILNFISSEFVSNFKYYSLKYFNFSYIEPESINETVLSILIKYDYNKFVRYILQNNEVYVNYKTIADIIFYLVSLIQNFNVILNDYKFK